MQKKGKQNLGLTIFFLYIKVWGHHNNVKLYMFENVCVEVRFEEAWT